MKKILAFLLAAITVLSLVSCSSSRLATEETKTAEKTAEAKTEENKETGPIVYPDTFAVGYSIIDISTVPLPMYDATAQTIHDPLMLTCTAFSDGEISEMKALIEERRREMERIYKIAEKINL